MSHIDDLWMKGPKGNKVKSARWGKGHRWLARWDDEAGKGQSKVFATKVKAQVFLSRHTVGTADGDWVEPAAGQRTVGFYRVLWLETKAGLAEGTRVLYEGIANGRVKDRWETIPVANVTKADVRVWLAEVRAEPLSASRTRTHYVVLSGILALAVEDKALNVNPAAGIKMPTPPKKTPKALGADALEAYLHYLEWPKPTLKEANRKNRPVRRPTRQPRAYVFGLVLVFSGLRFGECIRLDIPDLVGRQIRLEKSISTVGGRHVEADTKGHRHRTVPLPVGVVTQVVEEVGNRTEGPLLPAKRGGRWHHRSWERHHDRAVTDAGLPPGTTTHALRHTAVSMAIEVGADVKAVQKMVGHESGALTLDTYAELFDGRLEEIADALEDRVPKRSPRSDAHPSDCSALVDVAHRCA